MKKNLVFVFLTLAFLSCKSQKLPKSGTENKKAKEYFDQGDVAASSRQYDKAIEFFTKALDKDPKYIDAMFYLGDIYRDWGKYEEAKASYDKVLVVNKDYYTAHFSLGYLNFTLPGVSKHPSCLSHHTKHKLHHTRSRRSGIDDDCFIASEYFESL